jgi:hypothetical protein
MDLQEFRARFSDPGARAEIFGGVSYAVTSPYGETFEQTEAIRYAQTQAILDRSPAPEYELVLPDLPVNLYDQMRDARTERMIAPYRDYAGEPLATCVPGDESAILARSLAAESARTESVRARAEQDRIALQANMAALEIKRSAEHWFKRPTSKRPACGADVFQVQWSRVQWRDGTETAQAFVLSFGEPTPCPTCLTAWNAAHPNG